MSESASTSSIGSNSSHSKAPGAQLAHKPVPYPRQTINSTIELTKQLLAIDNDPSLGKLLNHIFKRNVYVNFFRCNRKRTKETNFMSCL